MPATFFSMPEKHWPNFATLGESPDQFDEGPIANLSGRPGRVFRLNIGVTGKTFDRVLGDAASRGRAGRLRGPRHAAAPPGLMGRSTGSACSASDEAALRAAGQTPARTRPRTGLMQVAGGGRRLARPGLAPSSEEVSVLQLAGSAAFSFLGLLLRPVMFSSSALRSTWPIAHVGVRLLDLEEQRGHLRRVFASTSLTKSPGTPWPMAAPMPPSG